MTIANSAIDARSIRLPGKVIGMQAIVNDLLERTNAMAESCKDW
ncbi:hypothetical protein SynBIOSE41_02151 [Synechococcus sp. BIOS-E4-1]|nr:hypothetical protein SynBIOSE41_02151 [Synechococcus sp. BIOS-E4-1]